MSTGYQIEDQEGIFYLTLTIVDWIDIFTRKIYRDLIIDSLRYCQLNKGLDIFAFVIMSNHLHIIVQSIKGDLSGTLRDFKKFTSNNIIQTINDTPESRGVWILERFKLKADQHSRNKEYQVWIQNNHAIQLYSPDFIREKLDYLHNNPVRAGWVDKPEDYIYSSARYYAGLDCLLNISHLGLPWRTIK
ncbi:MAG TPA: transposase [Bacteroidales bacterium]|nr:transposase [Bacteroidales bacterium]